MAAKAVAHSETPLHHRGYSLGILVVLVFGAGMVLLVSAAVTASSFEPEQASVSAPATVHTDATASGGAYVQFGAATSSGGHGSGGSGGTKGTRNNWPCSGCITYVPTGYDQTKPTILLTALHGDEGNPSAIEASWAPIASSNNVILFTPQCPTDKGCLAATGGQTNSWWGWLQNSSTYDDNWIGDQVTAIEQAYNVDLTQEFLTGWSGGADYLGWYAPAHADRFAAAGFVAGGVPYFQSCPAGHPGAYFLMGSNDFRYQSGQPSQVKQVYDSCSDPTVLTVLTGADHQATINAVSNGYGQTMLDWLEQHPLPAVPKHTAAPSAQRAAANRAARGQ